jgi:poly(beta-D-mannuronate) lyase
VTGVGAHIKSALAALALNASLGLAGSLEGGPMFDQAQAAETCWPVPEPVISLGIGSRYTAESDTRSDIDEASNDAVNKALRPIDKFIQDLSRDANTAMSDTSKRPAKAACVFAAILVWAEADALSDMQTMNASLAVPSRIGGIAIAFGQTRQFASQSPEQRKTIDDWLKRRAVQTKDYFDTGAPRNASRNNLRAWASFAVGEIGILTRDPALLAWSLESNKTMIAKSDRDGSFPLEMGRDKYALHYQLHAVAPLVTSMARLCEAGYGAGGADFNQLRKIARFSVDGVQNPDIVAQIAGAPQEFDTNLQRIAGMLAWLEPYKALTGDDLMKLDLPEIRPLLNSKLGGDLTRNFRKRQIRCNVRPNLINN